MNTPQKNNKMSQFYLKCMEKLKSLKQHTKVNQYCLLLLKCKQTLLTNFFKSS